MSGCSVDIDDINSSTDIPSGSSCSDAGCNVQLDGMPNRIVLHPDEGDNEEPKSDCVIFFPEDGGSSGGRSRVLSRDDAEDEICADYCAVVELKSNVSRPTHIKNQIKGSLEATMEVLSDCDEPPWGIMFFCLVAKNSVSSRKSIYRQTFSMNVRGNHSVFRLIPVSCGDSIMELLDQERVRDSIRIL